MSLMGDTASIISVACSGITVGMGIYAKGQDKFSKKQKEEAQQAKAYAQELLEATKKQAANVEALQNRSGGQI